MRKVFILLAVLVIGLGTALGYRLYRQREAKLAPSGGTGTVEGVEVDVVARLSARIRKIRVEEGDQVKEGQILVELDCDEPEAILAEARAQEALAGAGLRSARVATRAARHSARGARAAARAAQRLADSARAAIRVAKAAESVAEAQRKALLAERALAKRTVRRLGVLRDKHAGTELQYDDASGREESLTHRAEAAAANISVARGQEESASGNAAAALAQARSALARSRAAFAQADGSRSQEDVAGQRVAVARAAIRRAKIAVAECKLVAPSSGVVLTRSYEPGELALPGAKILTLANLHDVKTTFFIPNANLGDAKPGREVELLADAYPGEVFKGKILSVSSKAEFTPRNVQTREDRDRLVYAVKVLVPNPAGKLRPGMPVEVQIPGTRKIR